MVAIDVEFDAMSPRCSAQGDGTGSADLCTGGCVFGIATFEDHRQEVPGVIV
ncbi:hypothetical protein MMUC44124_21725 [Mycolicibacterium mucogenicum DSM 44124]|nr:hypothetical protein MMUC44124_21725 [Mycolicibacterium mucogenicum DSM 44124]